MIEKKKNISFPEYGLKGLLKQTQWIGELLAESDIQRERQVPQQGGRKAR